MKDRTSIIQTLNDRFRTTFARELGVVHMTPGISELPPAQLTEALVSVRNHNCWESDSDPYHEHDFGSVKLTPEPGSGLEILIFWKIDYYDIRLEMESEDPSDSTCTQRVMTIMLAEEY